MANIEKMISTELLHKEPQKAAAVLDEMPADEAVKVLLQFTSQDRVKLLLASTRTGELVRQMPEEEVWWTVKTVGEEDCIPIIKETTPMQFQYLLDMDMWKKDIWQPDACLRWLILTGACGKDKVVQWFNEIDTEMLLQCFMSSVVVRKKQEQEHNPLEDPWPYESNVYTLENMYFIQMVTSDLENVLLPIIKLLGATDREKLWMFFEAVMTENVPELEERAYEWREKRLAEYGFPPINEALSVYSFMSEHTISKLPVRKGVSDGMNVISYPLMAAGESFPLLVLALQKIHNAQLKYDIALELSRVAHKVVIADGRPITPDTVVSSLQKASGYLNIGLEYLSGADPKKAAEILTNHFVWHIFSVGYTVIMRARQKYRKFFKFGWPKGSEDALRLLDEQCRMEFEALSRRRPMRYVSVYTENDGSPLQNFKSIDEVRALENLITKWSLVGEHLQKYFGVTAKDVLAYAGDDILWSGVCMTIWANHVCSGRPAFSPLGEKEAEMFVISLLERTSDEDVKTKYLDDIFNVMTDAMSLTDEEVSAIKGFISTSLDRLLDEISDVEDEEMDERFVTSLWIEEHVKE